MVSEYSKKDLEAFKYAAELAKNKLRKLQREREMIDAQIQFLRRLEKGYVELTKIKG